MNKPYLDPTRTYTQLSADTVFPFEAIDQFKAWHDAAMNALKLKDEKIEKLESTIRHMDQDSQESRTRLPYALSDLQEARKQLEEARKGLAEAQTQMEELSKLSMRLQLEVGRLQRELSERQIPFPYTKFWWQTTTTSDGTGGSNGK